MSSAAVCPLSDRFAAEKPGSDGRRRASHGRLHASHEVMQTLDVAFDDEGDDDVSAGDGGGGLPTTPPTP